MRRCADVKSLVFVVDEEPVVALISGSDRLDERRLSTVAGGPVPKPSADEVPRRDRIRGGWRTTSRTLDEVAMLRR
jgi:hypothetical protein